MKRANNVDIGKAQAFQEQIQSDPTKARKIQVIEGEWIIPEGGAQFRSVVQFEGGQATFEVDNPTFMGGGGSLAGPMHYCFFGLASCYGYFRDYGNHAAHRAQATQNAGGGGHQLFGGLWSGRFTHYGRGPCQARGEQRCAAGKNPGSGGPGLAEMPVVFTLKNPVRLVPSLEITQA